MKLLLIFFALYAKQWIRPLYEILHDQNEWDYAIFC